MGLGIGAPFALAADFNDQDFGATVTNDHSSNIELLYIEATPTIAVKVNDRLNIGLGVNIGIAKHVKEVIKFTNLAGAGVSGSLVAQSDDDMPLPVAPWEFSTDPTAVTFTVGMQYKALPNLTLGAVYRGETPNEYEGDVQLYTNLPTPCNTIGGPQDNCGGGERFRFTMELPRHLQVGLAWQAMDNWELSFDAKWTNWSDATGFGSDLILDLTRSQNAPNTAFGAGGAGAQGLLCQLGVCGIDQIHVKADAQDTMTYSIGSKYDLNQTVSLLGGYSYEEQFMPNRTQNLIFPSSDRHWVTGGVELNVPSAMGLWKLNLGGQVIFYEENTISNSQNAGGLGPTAQVGPLGPQVGGAANAATLGTQQNPYTIDGHLWTVGLGATLFFGANRRTGSLRPTTQNNQRRASLGAPVFLYSVFMSRKYTINVRRRPVIQNDIAVVPLTDGYEAIIDAADAEFIARWNWYVVKRAAGQLFAGRQANIDGKRRVLPMHRALLQPPKSMVVIHIDGNGLNNRRSNLRLITQRENAMANVRGKRP